MPDKEPAVDSTRRTLLAAAAAAPRAFAQQSTEQGESAMRRIAIEEAFVTQEIADQWKVIIDADAVGEPGFKKMGETILADSTGTRLIHERLIDLGEGRIKDMDETSVDMHVISLTSPGVQVFPGDLAAELAKDANDQLAHAVQQRRRESQVGIEPARGAQEPGHGGGGKAEMPKFV